MRSAIFAILTLVVCPPSLAESFSFKKASSKPGDSMVQHAFVHTESVQTYEQSNQIISTTDREVRNTQVRNVQTVSTNPAIVVVKYEEAHLRVGKNRFLAKKTVQPVAQKSYRVQRDDGKLLVSDLAGKTPPPDELRIVESTMSWVGQPNELAEFLDGRTIALGEQLILPPEMAAKIFGDAVGMAGIETATLDLQKTKRIQGQDCAVFGVTLKGIPSGDQEKRLIVRGKISVDPTTCRTVAAEVKSDLDAAEERGPAGATFTVKQKGKVHVAIQARY